MKLFDSHAHLDDEKFDEDREPLSEEIHKSGVEQFVSAGYSLEGSKKAIELSKKYDFIYATVGISPNDIPQTREELWKLLEEIENLGKIKKVVAQRKKVCYTSFRCKDAGMLELADRHD